MFSGLVSDKNNADVVIKLHTNIQIWIRENSKLCSCLHVELLYYLFNHIWIQGLSSTTNLEFLLSPFTKIFKFIKLLLSKCLLYNKNIKEKRRRRETWSFSIYLVPIIEKTNNNNWQVSFLHLYLLSRTLSSVLLLLTLGLISYKKYHTNGVRRNNTKMHGLWQNRLPRRQVNRR